MTGWFKMCHTVLPPSYQWTIIIIGSSHGHHSNESCAKRGRFQTIHNHNGKTLNKILSADVMSKRNKTPFLYSSSTSWCCCWYPHPLLSGYRNFIPCGEFRQQTRRMESRRRGWDNDILRSDTTSPFPLHFRCFLMRY